MEIFSNPHDFDILSSEDLCLEFNLNLATFQLELIEVQSAIDKPKSVNDIEFWRDSKYNELKKFAAKFYSCFSSIYTCESTFSAMNAIKSKLRTRLTDESLESAIICRVSEIEPRFDEIVTKYNFRMSN